VLRVDATLNTWFHVAVTRSAEATSVRLFVNGVPGPAALIADPPTGVFTFRRAGDFAGQYFQVYC
jgi:hypothetical protein